MFQLSLTAFNLSFCVCRGEGLLKKMKVLQHTQTLAVVFPKAWFRSTHPLDFGTSQSSGHSAQAPLLMSR